MIPTPTPHAGITLTERRTTTKTYNKPGEGTRREVDVRYTVTPSLFGCLVVVAPVLYNFDYFVWHRVLNGLSTGMAILQQMGTSCRVCFRFILVLSRGSVARNTQLSLNH